MIKLYRALLGVAASGYMTACFSQSVPPSLKEIKEQHEAGSEAFKAALAQLCAYYEPSSAGQESGFDRDVRELCEKALDNHFRVDTISSTATIVFDIDETMLSHYGLFKECNFECGLQDWRPYREAQRCLAIKPVRDFCQVLKVLGYTLILISSRRDLLVKQTAENLAREGYEFDELILMPMSLWNQKSGAADHNGWKEAMRKECSKKYKIVGCVGDSDGDFQGECCGVKVRLPNYLY